LLNSITGSANSFWESIYLGPLLTALLAYDVFWRLPIPSCTIYVQYLAHSSCIWDSPSIIRCQQPLPHNLFPIMLTAYLIFRGPQFHFLPAGLLLHREDTLRMTVLRRLNQLPPIVTASLPTRKTHTAQPRIRTTVAHQVQTAFLGLLSEIGILAIGIAQLLGNHPIKPLLGRTGEP
jgi:hypothetical protein